jgi:predicted neutral ceramidase superfamily lipid hydrolase
MDGIKEFMQAALTHFTVSIFNGLLPVLAISAICWLIFYAISRRPQIAGFACFFAVVGSSLGLFLGASREPAVNAFLPAIITFLSAFLVYTFPKNEKLVNIAFASEKEKEPTFIRSFVLSGIGALMISSVMAAMWGGSVRGLKEEAGLRYEEWRLNYETIELPLRLEQLKKQLESQ